MERRWTDERLDDRARVVDETLREIREDVRALAPMSGQVGRLEVVIEALSEDVREAKKAADDARNAADGAAAAATKGRKDTLLAMLGFAGPVAVALIGGVVALVLGGGGPSP